jgi:hypothetical protein
MTERSEDMEIPEIVGSKDLREVFKGKTVQGTFFINNIEFHQFRANSIESLIAQINARENEAYVTAAIDDGYHLVLEAHSPAQILLRSGPAYVEAPAVGTDATAQAVRAAIEATKEGDKEQKNTILEDLGLESTHDTMEQPAPYGMQAGMTAEDRKKARHDRAVARGAIRGVTEPVENVGSGSRAVPSVGTEDGNRKFNPVTPAGKLTATPAQKSDNGWAPGANNPTFQVAPASNSDREPTANDL